MNRRTVIRHFLVFSAGAVLIPSCMQEESKSSILLKNIIVSGEQEKLLAALTETIIPKTNTPGANDISSHLFVLMMVDDCYSSADQKKFIDGLNQFEEFAKKKSGTSFEQSTFQQKKELLAAIENKKDIPVAMTAFYSITKSLTIQSFVSSKYFLTNIQVYELVPGRFHGCVPVKNNSAHG